MRIIRNIWTSVNNPSWVLAFALFIPVLYCKTSNRHCAFLFQYFYWYLLIFWIIYFGLFILFAVISVNELGELLKKIKEQGFTNVAQEWVTDFLDGLKKMPLKIFFNLGLFAFFYIIIIESYLYFPVKYVYKVILFFLALYSLTFIYINPGKKFKRKVAGGIKILSFSILIFLTPISTTFEKQFLEDGKSVDRAIFSNLAANKGKNYHKVMETRIKLDVKGVKDTSPGKYADTFTVYIQQLKSGSLEEKMYPGKILEQDKTVHAVFIRRALEILQEKTVPLEEKQKVMETLLDYLACVIQRNRMAEVKNDVNFPVKRRFLENIIELIETGNPGETPSIRRKLKILYCELTRKTTINPYIIKNFLQEEVEPCPSN
jgi:hypothetical protein